MHASHSSADLISIIAVLDPRYGNGGKLMKSIAAQTCTGFELVCVSPGELPRSITKYDLPMAEVRCDGDAAAMRRAGLEASSGRYVLFLNGCSRLAPGAAARLADSASRFKRDHVEVFSFHMQVADSKSGRYLSTRYEADYLPLSPFGPKACAGSILQICGANLGGMLIEREHLDVVLRGGDFACDNPIDDELVAIRALCGAETVHRTASPLSGIVYDREEFAQSLTLGQIERRLELAAGAAPFFERHDRRVFAGSYAQWLADFALGCLDGQTDGMSERVLEAIGATVSPVVRDLRDCGAGAGNWENRRKVELLELDKMALIEERIDCERRLVGQMCDMQLESIGCLRDGGSDRADVPKPGRRKRRLFGR